MIVKAEATLRVYSTTLRATELSSLIGIAPSSSHEMGDPVGRGSARRRESMWLATEIASGENCVEDSLNALLSIAEPAVERVRSREEIELEVFLGLFSDNEQLNFDLPNAVIKKVAALGVDLLVSGYVDVSEVEG